MQKSRHDSVHQKQNISDASIQDMIGLLKQYEKMCLEKSDFTSAEEAKNKIEFLKSQQIVFKREKMDVEDKENMENVCKIGDEEIREFQQFWDDKLQNLIESLKQVQKGLQEEHEKQLNLMVEKLQKQEVPKIKYSSQVLDLRKYLRNLIKVKNYKQAEIVKNKLEWKQKQQGQKWIEKHEIKKKIKLESLKKKQQTQLSALRLKAEAAFNQNIKERDQKFEILLKKNRKRRIESSKVPRERLRAKTALLNQSKSFMTVSRN